MSAPNKIYVSADPFGFMHAYDAENYPPDGEAYIRKDYLLEWAEKFYEMYMRITEQSGNDLDFGRMNAFSMLINKLNES